MIFKIAPCTCELSDPKIKKSPTLCDFENFYPNLILTSNFETHRNVDDNFYFVYKYIQVGGDAWNPEGWSIDGFILEGLSPEVFVKKWKTFEIC